MYSALLDYRIDESIVSMHYFTYLYLSLWKHYRRTRSCSLLEEGGWLKKKKKYFLSWISMFCEKAACALCKKNLLLCIT